MMLKSVNLSSSRIKLSDFSFRTRVVTLLEASDRLVSKFSTDETKLWFENGQGKTVDLIMFSGLLKYTTLVYRQTFRGIMSA